MSRFWRYVRLLMLVVSLSGCAMGPDFHHPEKPKSTSYTPQPMPKRTVFAAIRHGQAQTFQTEQQLPRQWWRLLRSPALNQLVEDSLHANPDTAAASEAVKMAHENTKIQQTAFFPLVTGNYNPSRQLTAGTLSSNLASNAYLYTLNTLNFNMYYMPDVLGFTRRTVETAKAQEEAQVFQCQAVYLTLAANVVLAAVQEALIREQIKVTRETIQLGTHLLNLLEKQSTLGAVSQMEVASQQAFVAQIESALPPLELSLDVQRHVLTSLRGVSPSYANNPTFTLDQFHLPTNLPMKLPGKLVQQRPDVRAAEANLHAASAQIGVAIANRFPNVMIAANGGLMPVIFDTASIPLGFPMLPTGGTRYWMFAGNILGTLFDAGSLLYQQRMAEAQYRQAQAQYRRVVLNAFQNVADALKAIQHDAELLRAAVKQELAAKQNMNIARQQLKLGMVGQAELIQAEQFYQQALANLAQSQANRLADTVGLFQALGGSTPSSPLSHQFWLKF